MVRGLDLFRERFRPFQGMITLIGGAACDEWFTTNGMNFRATDDLDLVIMMDDYFGLIQAHHDERDGLWVANATSLIPLKALAWLNLTKAKAAGEAVDSRNIKKHCADVFRLAATLPGVAGPDLPQSIKDDLVSFLQEFPPDSADWTAILASLSNSIPGTFRPADLREAIQIYFGIGR